MLYHLFMSSYAPDIMHKDYMVNQWFLLSCTLHNPLKAITENKQNRQYHVVTLVTKTVCQGVSQNSSLPIPLFQDCKNKVTDKFDLSRSIYNRRGHILWTSTFQTQAGIDNWLLMPSQQWMS